MTEYVQAGPTRGRAARAGAALVSIAIAGLTIAGCGGGSSTRTVASLPGHDGTTRRSSLLTVAQSDRDMVDFARCMRAHGVQASDPVHLAGHSGLSINLPTRDAATRSAYAACDHFLQPIEQAKAGAARTDPPALLAALTAYAQCMRQHDISMLDPTPDGQLSLGNVPGITDDFGRYSPQFHTADSACRHLLHPTVHDDGTGP